MSEKPRPVIGTLWESAKYGVSERLRRPTEVFATLGMVSVAVFGAVSGAEPKPIVNKEAEVATDVLRQPVIEKIAPDKFMSYALLEGDVSTNVTYKEKIEVSSSVPGSEIINKGLKLAEREYSVTFNPVSQEEGEKQPDGEVKNGVVVSIGLHGEGERVVDLDAPRHTGDGENNRPVITVNVNGLSTRLIDNGNEDGNRYATSGNWATLPEGLADAFRNTGSDNTTKSEYIKDTMKVISKGLAYETIVNECVAKEGEARNVITDTVEGSIKEWEAANFASLRPDEPPITTHDVVLNFNNTEVEAQGMDNFRKTREDFGKEMEGKGFDVTNTDKFNGGEESKCKVSPNLKRMNDKGEEQ